jgi:type VI secretion system secreted protein VgrG
MARFSQSKRPLQIRTPLGEDTFMLVGLTGEEGVSRSFVLTLQLVSEDSRVDGKALLREPVTVTVPREGEDPVHFHGLVRRFTQLGQEEGLTAYGMEIVPWLWFLSLHRDCRIFQETSAPDIVEKVFRERGFSDFEFRLNGTYPAREYCAQYRESDFQFVSRLLEEEGIHYFFEHSADRHLLVLSDHSKLAPACDGGETLIAVDSRDRVDVVDRFEAVHGVHVGEVEFRDFDFEQAPSPLVSTISGDGEEKVYDFHPGRFTTREEGERLARVVLEGDEARRQVVTGKGNCRHFRSGFRFDLSGHYRRDVDGGYLLTAVRHKAKGGGWRSGDSAEFDYRVEFTAIPVDIPYRPPRSTPRPHIPGSQTAVVVGKSGEEIWVDKYGRVKVKFHWDRSDAKDENSSCWIRVSSGWAGKNWGAIHTPRIGEEVIVAFLEGDPDRPIIIGRVYNADHMPPYALPDDKTQSGIKSRSSKDAEASNFNEIRFEDKKDEEQVYIRAEKDKVVEVVNDRTETVGHDEKITIENDRTEEVKKNESITIGEDRKESVGGNESITIGKDRSEEVKGDESITIDGKRTESVKGDDSVTVGGTRSLSVDGDDKVAVKGKQQVDVTGSITLDAKDKIVLSAVSSIEVKVGGNSIKIDQSGIKVKGIKVEVEGIAQANVKAPTTTVEGTAMVELKGVMAQVKGDAMLKAQGGITMIN